MSAPVSTNDGTFSLTNVPLYAGTNALVVTVTDVTGNLTQQVRRVFKTLTNCLEYFLYDGNGNLTNWVSGGTNWVYEWDWADRLTKATSNGVVLLENWYDAGSRRIAKKELVNGQTNYTLYILDGWSSVAVLNTNGATVETFTRGLGLAGDIGTLVALTHHAASTTNGTFYIHANHRGDVVLTRSGTTTVGSYGYSAFGNLNSLTGTDVSRFKFSSKERDEATLWSYYGYRFYAPAWQRWPNRDPIGEAGGVNLYGFVYNSPSNYIDPDGEDAVAIPILVQPKSPNPINLAFCAGAAAGTALCLMFPDTMTKPGEWIGNLICPMSNSGERGIQGKDPNPWKGWRPNPKRPGWGWKKHPQTGKDVPKPRPPGPPPPNHPDW